MRLLNLKGVDREAKKFIRQLHEKLIPWYPTSHDGAEGYALYGIAKRCSMGAIVEIGSFAGGSTLILAAGSHAGNRMPVYSIDPFIGINYTPDKTYTTFKGDKRLHAGTPNRKYYVGQGKTFPSFWNRVKRFGMEQIIHPIVDYSELAREKYRGPKIEFLFIDGDHRYNYVKMDFDLWEPLLVEGGTLMMHERTWPGPRRVIKKDVLGSGRFKEISEDVRKEFMGNYTGNVCFYAQKTKIERVEELSRTL